MTHQQVNRLTEVAFFTVLKQIELNKKTAAAPYGTTLPKVLASILKGVNPDVIDYSYRMLNTASEMPTTKDCIVALKYFGVSANRSPWGTITYYKWWNKWHEEGCPLQDSILSELQIEEVKKFLRFFKAVIYGKKGMVGSLKV